MKTKLLSVIILGTLVFAGCESPVGEQSGASSVGLLGVNPGKSKVLGKNQSALQMRTKTRSAKKVKLDGDQLDSAIIAIEKVVFIAKDDTQYVVTRTSQEQELIGQQNGYGLLYSENPPPPGIYKEIRISIAEGGSRVVANGQSYPLKVPSEVLRLQGEVELRGGRIANIVIDFDPAAAIKQTGKKFRLDHKLTLLSVASLTPEQDTKIRDAFGEQADALIEKSDVIAETQMTGHYERADEVNGSPMLFTTVSLHVDDALKGATTDSSIQLELMGGVSGDTMILVSGVARFLPDERSLVLLQNRDGGMGTTFTEDGLPAKVTIE